MKRLLAFMLLTPEGVGREELGDRLDPEPGWDEAEQQLYSLASSLRKSLEPRRIRGQKSRCVIAIACEQTFGRL